MPLWVPVSVAAFVGLGLIALAIAGYAAAEVLAAAVDQIDRRLEVEDGDSWESDPVDY